MTTAPDALANLERALNALTTALSGGRADAVLAAEEPLAAAVRALCDAAWPPDLDRARARAGLRAAYIALARAELLGRSSAALLGLLVPHAGYDAAGRSSSAGPMGLSAKG